MDTKSLSPNVERRGIAVRLTNGASAINCPIGNVGSGISIITELYYSYSYILFFHLFIYSRNEY